MARVVLVVLAASQQRVNQVAEARGLRHDQVRWARYLTDLDLLRSFPWLVDWSLDSHPQNRGMAEAVAQRLANDRDPNRWQSTSVHL